MDSFHCVFDLYYLLRLTKINKSPLLSNYTVHGTTVIVYGTNMTVQRTTALFHDMTLTLNDGCDSP